MTVMEKLSFSITDKIAEFCHKKDNQKEIIQYGIYILLGDLLKFIILLSLAYALGILFYVIVSIVSMGILRSFAGGIHARTWTGCFLLNTMVNIGIVYTALRFDTANMRYICYFAYLFCYVVLYLYAPSDHENKPIIGVKHKALLRRLSFIILTVQLCLSVFTSPVISNILTLSAIINAVFMLPIAYRISRNRKGEYYFLKQ